MAGCCSGFEGTFLEVHTGVNPDPTAGVPADGIEWKKVGHLREYEPPDDSPDVEDTTDADGRAVCAITKTDVAARGVVGKCVSDAGQQEMVTAQLNREKRWYRSTLADNDRQAFIALTMFPVQRGNPRASFARNFELRVDGDITHSTYTPA
ncbi:hypothetical protein [Alienimonas sp. DA493]|uniref:hypothetical protein n=1 Tax=Alienimonas sp. DA493 TaxID=3373605 RepID=UPI003754792A